MPLAFKIFAVTLEIDSQSGRSSMENTLVVNSIGEQQGIKTPFNTAERTSPCPTPSHPFSLSLGRCYTQLQEKQDRAVIPQHTVIAT